MPLRLGQGSAFLVAEAGHLVIVDHAGCLHVRVDDRAADELEATLLQVLAERIGFRRGCLKVGIAAIPVLYRRAADEIPDVVTEAVELVLNLQKCLI